MRGEESGSPSSLSEVDSALGGSTTSPSSCRKVNSGCWSVGDREVNYECYGEGDDLDEPDQQQYISEVDESRQLQPNSLPPVTLGQRNSWVRRSLRCSPSTTGGRRMGGGGTAAGAAQQLFRSPSFSSGRSSGVALDGDDLHSDASMEDDVHDLMDQVKILQSKVEVLGDNQSDSQERIVRVKQDNSVLQARVVMLEEQIRESEQRAEDRLAEEQKRNRELIQRIETEKTLTVENYSIKQSNIEKNSERLEEDIQRLRNKVDRYQKERNELEDRALEAEVASHNMKEETKNTVAQSRKEQQDEQERANRVIEDLRGEVQRLKGALEINARSRLPSTDANANTYEQLRTAKEENRALQEQLEELQGQLMTKGLETGRELVTGDLSNSLAAEFEAMTVDEVREVDELTVEQLKKSVLDLTDENEQFKKYIGGILDQILIRCPELLEVKASSS